MCECTYVYACVLFWIIKRNPYLHNAVILMSRTLDLSIGKGSKFMSAFKIKIFRFIDIFNE